MHRLHRLQAIDSFGLSPSPFRGDDRRLSNNFFTLQTTIKPAYVEDIGLSFRAVTFNMNEQEIPDSIEDILGITKAGEGCSIYMVATQEGTMAQRQWELKIQETLGRDYVMVAADKLLGIHLCIMMQRELIWETCDVETSHVATKLKGMVNTKGTP